MSDFLECFSIYDNLFIREDIIGNEAPFVSLMLDTQITSPHITIAKFRIQLEYIQWDKKQ